MSEDDILVTEGLTKSFGDFQAVSEVSLCRSVRPMLARSSPAQNARPAPDSSTQRAPFMPKT